MASIWPRFYLSSPCLMLSLASLYPVLWAFRRLAVVGWRLQSKSLFLMVSALKLGTLNLGAFMRVIQPQHGFVLQRVRLEFIRNFADPILDKTALQDRIFGLYPVTQEQLSPGDHFTIGAEHALSRDLLR